MAIMNTGRRVAAVLCALFAVSSPAQDIPRVSGEVLDVSIVNVDCVVTDKKGNRVKGLTKDDFEILEDGKLQAISNFAEYRDEDSTQIGEGKVEAGGETVRPSQPRALVVFVDDLHLAKFKTEPVFDSLKSTLHSIVRPNDVVLIARWRLHMMVEQSFTSNLALLDAAIDRCRAASTGPEVDLATQIREEQAQYLEFLEAAAAQRGQQFTSSTDDVLQMFEIESRAQLVYWELQEKTKALDALISSLPTESKKAMILLASRMSAVAGGEFYAATQNTNRMMEPEFRSRFRTDDMMAGVIKAAAAHNVTLYTFLPEGLKTDSDTSSAMNGSRAMRYQNYGWKNYVSLTNETVVLQDMANATGGTMKWSSVEVAKALPAIRDDLTSYYSLAYRVPPRHDGTQHKVSVRMKTRSLTVRAKRQTIERPAAEEMHDRVVATLYTNSVRPQIPIELAIGEPLQSGMKRYRFPLKVFIPVSHLMTVQEGENRRGAFTVHIASGRSVGSSAAVQKQTVPFTITPDKAGVATFTYEFEFVADMITNRVAVVVVDELSHETGFARGDLWPNQNVTASMQ